MIRSQAFPTRFPRQSAEKGSQGEVGFVSSGNRQFWDRVVGDEFSY